MVFSHLNLNENNVLGGGFINISAPTISMVNGTLSASGFPLASEKNTSNCQNVVAGTGGTIGLFGSNFNLSSNSKLLAEGGCYCGK